jgi:hypothetical protein
MAAIGISVDVPGMAAAAEFFSKGLGFEPLRQVSPQTMVLDAGGIELWLLCKPEASPAVPTRSATGSA